MECNMNACTFSGIFRIVSFENKFSNEKFKICNAYRGCFDVLHQEKT